MLACYPGRRHCKLKAGASLRNNGGGGFGGKLEIRRSRISREREKGERDRWMVNLREVYCFQGVTWAFVAGGTV